MLPSSGWRSSGGSWATLAGVCPNFGRGPNPGETAQGVSSRPWEWWVGTAIAVCRGGWHAEQTFRELWSRSCSIQELPSGPGSVGGVATLRPLPHTRVLATLHSPFFSPPAIREPERGEAASLLASVYYAPIFMLQLIKAPSEAITRCRVYK